MAKGGRQALGVGLDKRTLEMRRIERQFSGGPNSDGRKSFPRRSNGQAHLKPSAHKRKRCLDCGGFYPKSSKQCPNCSSSSFRLRCH